MLNVKNLSCGYEGAEVIKDLSFELRAGQKLCVLGGNGAGKSTLLKALAGLLSYKGEVKVNGVDLNTADCRQRARLVGIMSQFAYASFDYTVYECVALGRYAHKKPGLGRKPDGEEDRARVLGSLKLCGVSDLASRYITRLSGGQLQRVFLARLFCQDPALMLLDEPANHLDPAAQKALIAAIEEWAETPGKAVIGVFHDVNAALSFAGRLLLLRRGEYSLHDADGFDLKLLNEVYGMDMRAYMEKLLRRWR